MIKQTEIKNDHSELINFVRKKFPEAQGALITGSYGTKNEKKSSDIDLIIFSEVVLKPFVEKITIESQKYDIIYLSTHYNYLIKNLYYDINSRYGVYSNMISTSRILFDDNNLLLELILFSKNLIFKEYGTLNFPEIEFKVKLISNALEDLDDVDTYGEYYFTVSLIVDELTNLILAYRSSTIGRGKNKARELNKIAPEFYSTIMDAIEKHKKTEFKKIVNSNLDFFGGVLNNYTVKNTYSINTGGEKEYEILIENKYVYDSFLYEEVFKIRSFLNKQNVTLKYYYNYNEFLIIRVECDSLSHKKSKDLVGWFITTLKINIKDKVHLRIRKSKLLPFTGNKINSFLEFDLIQITDLVTKKEIIFNNHLELLAFGKLFLEQLSFYFPKHEQKELFQYIYLSNLPSNYDLDSNKSNYYQLIDLRNSIITEIDILSKSLDLSIMNNDFIEQFIGNSDFLSLINNDEYETDFDMFKINYFRDENLMSFGDSAKVILINLYVKYIFDVLNLKQLSLIARYLYKKC